MKLSDCLGVFFTAGLAFLAYNAGFKEGQHYKQKVLIKTIYVSQSQTIVQDLIKEKSRLLERSKYQDSDPDVYKTTLDHIYKINLLLDRQKCTK